MSHTTRQLPRAGGMRDQAGRFMYALNAYTNGFEEGRMQALHGGGHRDDSLR